jgi:CubicO group peptidase (beta-lactamase class C family)
VTLVTEAHRTLEVAERVQRIENGIVPDTPVWSLESDHRSTIAERMAYYRTPGLSLAVINHGDLEWARGYGVLEFAEASLPVTPEACFQACSISKHVAMLAALRLVQEGRLDLDEDVNRYLTSWKIPANGSWQPRITLRQLLGHTAGLTQNWYRGFRRAGPDEDLSAAETTPTLLQVLEGQPPANTPPVRVKLIPGSQYRYSGSHYSVVQQLLMDVTGMPFPDLMKQLVLDPLGMRSSSYDQSYPESHSRSAAVGHYAGGEQVHGKWRIMPEMAGAGLWTSAVDLAQVACELYRAHAGRPTRLLRKDVVDQALAPQLVEYFGLGVQLDGRGPSQRFGHGGDNIGYKCLSTTYVENGMGIIAMTNCDDGWWVIEEVTRAVAEEYAWPDYLPNHRLSTTTDPESYAGYVGDYEIALHATVTLHVLTMSGDQAAGTSPQLVLQAPGQEPLVLRPTKSDAAAIATFVADRLNSEVRFRKNEAGEVTELLLVQEQQEISAKKVR